MESCYGSQAEPRVPAGDRPRDRSERRAPARPQTCARGDNRVGDPVGKGTVNVFVTYPPTAFGITAPGQVTLSFVPGIVAIA